MIITERTHDKIYLNEDRCKKEYFKVLYKMIQEQWGGKHINLLDIGCATGDFLYFAQEELPNASLSGLEIMPELIAKINFEANIYCGDITKQNTLPDMKFDCITMLGVLSIFDDFQEVLDNVFRLMNDNGTFYLFGIFNPENIDVLIKSRSSDRSFSKDSSWETGWNCFSLKSIKDYCISKGYKCSFTPFNIGFKIPKHKDDPLRSWTEETKNGLMIINGLQLKHNFYFCEINK